MSNNSIISLLGSGSGANDPFFSLVKVLLHMDGVNGGTTTADVKNNTLHLFGGAQLSNEVSLEGATSLKIAASNSGLSMADVAADVSASPFCLEAKVWVTSLAQGQIAGSFRWYTGYRGGYTLGITPQGAVAFYYNGNNVSSTYFKSADGIVATGQKHHIAATRVSDTLYLWLNGNQVGSVTLSAGYVIPLANNYSNSGYGSFDEPNGFHVGYVPADAKVADQFPGYVDEVRLTIGASRYTANFVPDTGPWPNQ